MFPVRIYIGYVSGRKTRKSFSRSTLIVILAAAVIVLIWAGGFPGWRVPWGFSGFNLFRNAQRAILQGVDGDVSLKEGGSLPETFPKDFPVYPGAILKNSWSAKTDAAAGTSVIWESRDNPLAVFNFYKESLTSKGWKITASFNDQKSYTLSFEKGNVSGFLGISDNEVTTISATLGF